MSHAKHKEELGIRASMLHSLFSTKVISWKIKESTTGILKKGRKESSVRRENRLTKEE
jgi:hypothetical protein